MKRRFLSSPLFSLPLILAIAVSTVSVVWYYRSQGVDKHLEVIGIVAGTYKPDVVSYMAKVEATSFDDTAGKVALTIIDESRRGNSF